LVSSAPPPDPAPPPKSLSLNSFVIGYTPSASVPSVLVYVSLNGNLDVSTEMPYIFLPLSALPTINCFFAFIFSSTIRFLDMPEKSPALADFSIVVPPSKKSPRFSSAIFSP